MVIVIDAGKLKEDTIKAGLSMAQLAKNIGCSRAHMSEIYAHRRNPSGKIAVKICEQIKGRFEDYFFIESVNKTKQNK